MIAGILSEKANWIVRDGVWNPRKSLMPFEIVEVSTTPNPNAIKFILDQPVSDAPTSFLKAAAAEVHPLAKRLFSIDGVTSILLFGDFVTINKLPTAKWPAIKRKVTQILRET